MAEDLTTFNLDVYDKGDGPWNPEHGNMTIPDNWDFLPMGDAYVTRTVKAGGIYWVAWRPRGKNRPHRRKLGLWAPAGTIEQARTKAAETAAKREKNREPAARQRARVECRYREELEAAIIRFLEFDDPHEGLARQIAHQAAEHAATIRSGRVGRTRTLTLGERATLAARAHIRHQFTDYHKRLDAAFDETVDSLSDEDLENLYELPQVDEADYRDIKADAARDVDEFLLRHRAPPPAAESSLKP